MWGTLGIGGYNSLDWKQHSKENEQIRKERKCKSGTNSEIISNDNSKHSKELFGGNKLGEVFGERTLGWSDTQYGGFWKSEPAVGRVAHGIPNRVDRLTVLGNAIVP